MHYSWLAVLLLVLNLTSLGAAHAQRSWQRGDRIKFNLPPDRERMTLYSEPGFDYHTCQFQPERCAPLDKSWPSNDATVEIVYDKNWQPQIKEIEVENYYGETERRRYLRVRVDYASESGWINNKIVWVEEKYIIEQSQTDRYAAIREEVRRRKLQDPDCEDPQSPSPMPRDQIKALGDIARLAQAEADRQIADTAKLLSPAVGQCAYSGPITQAAKNWDLNKVIYDQAVLPNLSLNTVDQRAIQRIIGRPLTKEDLVNIDALSRTLYSEMARCYNDGLHYPLAVAKVIANRADYAQENRSLQPGVADPFRVRDSRHLSDKPMLARIVTAPYQFSVWNPKKGKGELNSSGLSQALCPPSGPTYWKTNARGQALRTPPFEQEIWQDTLKIATQAVLFPDNFENRTKDVQELYYTSGIENFYGLPQVTRWIDNKPISNGECMNLFKGLPRDTARRPSRR